MYISAEAIRDIERKYGTPAEVHLSYEMTGREFDMVRRSQKHDRAHDITLFILEGDSLVVIKKPMYPPGAYRAPSGGINPGEGFEEGSIREAYEETGLSVELEEYVLRARVKFTNESEAIDWTSHVFTANPVGGALEPIDVHEIVEARFATLDELNGPINEALIASGSTGLRYRAELGDIVTEMLVERGRLARPGRTTEAARNRIETFDLK
ncbi:MAG TPA: NUDIX hydrolase [Blastocatellia bacterium]|nr:NUDIX hydrolase [Blastocatellia bacterium]